MKRRALLKTLGLAIGGVSGCPLLHSDQEAEAVRGRVNTNSEPTKLRITDLRVVPVRGQFRSYVVRLDTNQGLEGYGEIRDGASATYALMLKSRVLGENPCHVDRIFRKLKQFGGHGRQAGGVVAIEMACWDLAMEHGISMALHMAGSPVALFASVHCAAATENFLVLECHDVDTPHYDELVGGVPKPLVDAQGFVEVPNGPGLGITLEEEFIKEQLRRNGQDPEKLYFPPTEEWNRERSHDRLWSHDAPSRAGDEHAG